MRGEIEQELTNKGEGTLSRSIAGRSATASNDLSVHRVMRCLVKHQIRFSTSDLGLIFCISLELPGDANAAGRRTALRIAKIIEQVCVSR